MKKLELSAQKVNDAIKNADSAAKTAKEMVIDDDATLVQLEKTTARLTDAMEATERVTSSLEEALVTSFCVKTLLEQVALHIHYDHQTILN